MSLASAADNIESPASSDGEDGAAHVASSDQWVTRCICINNSQVEGFMIECERCQVWQHGDCVQVDKGKVPDEYFCELCRPELHDARGLWTGGVRSQPIGKVAVSRGSASKKKKTKSRKQNSQGGTLAGITAANVAGEGPSDNAMIDVRGTSSQPDPITPGAVQPDSASNGAEDDQKNLSREERKIVKIMQTIQMMEDRDKKRRRSGGTNATPDPQASANKGQAADEQTSKRRKSRPNSTSKRTGLDIPTLTIGGYDVEQLKTSPALLRNLFPISPMYLGSKIFLLQHVTLMENPSNGISSAPSTPIAHHQSLIKESISFARAASLPEDVMKSVKDERRTCRSPSPASRPGPSNMSANSSPFSSQPISPAQPVPESPVNASTAPPAVSEDPSSDNKMSAEPVADEITPSELVRASSDSSNCKPGLATIPRLSTIPKVSVTSARPPENTSSHPGPSIATKTNLFSPGVAIPPIPGTNAVTPLSSLSELMQTYMNAPPTEFAVSGHLDLSRFKPNPGMLVPPPSVPLVPPRWNSDQNGNAPHLFMPTRGYLPAMPFSRRPMPPPPSSFPSNNQQSHPS